jgi:hypothetical protein
VGLYTRLQGRADFLIRKYGKLRTVTRGSGTSSLNRPTDAVAQSSYDPATGNITAPLPNSPPLTAQFQVFMVTFPYEIRFVNNTTIKLTDIWGMFPALELPDIPQSGDKLDMDGVQYTFGVVKPLSPGGVSLFYECHLSQG